MSQEVMDAPVEERTYETTDEIVEALGGDESTSEMQDAEEQAAPIEDDNSDAELPIPDGWEDGTFKGLPRNIRDLIRSQSTAHATALSDAAKKSAEAKAEYQKYMSASNAEMQNAINVMRHIVEGEYAGVDWNGLRHSDPQTFFRLYDEARQRMGAIQAIQQRVQHVAQMYDAQRQQARVASLKNEMEATVPLLKNLYGAGFENKKYGEEMREYLTKAGLSPQAIGSISKGYELVLATKAMLYDKLQAARATAAQKLADAPVVSQPKSVSNNDGGRGDSYRKAMANLRNNPRSTDAIADVLAAM